MLYYNIQSISVFVVVTTKKIKQRKQKRNFEQHRPYDWVFYLRTIFWAIFRIWRLEFMDDTRNKYTTKTCLDSLNMFSRYLFIDFWSRVSHIFWSIIVLRFLELYPGPQLPLDVQNWTNLSSSLCTYQFTLCIPITHI